MTEQSFRVVKGLTVANSSASANISPIDIIIGTVVANTTGVFTPIINSASINVGALFTANSTLVNAAAINCRGTVNTVSFNTGTLNITEQINTATFFATTSVNVGANVQITTIHLLVGNTIANLIANSIIIKLANTTGIANLTPLALTIGTSIVNSTAHAAGANVLITTAGFYKNTFPVIYSSDEDQAVTGGATISVKDLGTKSTGTVTPDPGDRPMQKYTNAGAHTLAPGSVYGTYMLDIINTTGAGAITTSGWTKVVGDSFNTTTTSKFRCHCSVSADMSMLQVVEVV